MQVGTGVCGVSKPLGQDANSWVVTFENQIVTSGNVEYQLSETIQEGDILVSKKERECALIVHPSSSFPPPSPNRASAMTTSS